MPRISTGDNGNFYAFGLAKAITRLEGPKISLCTKNGDFFSAASCKRNSILGEARKMCVSFLMALVGSGRLVCFTLVASNYVT